MSDYKVPAFIKRDGDALLFSGEGEFVFYVPEAFFDRKCAIVLGEYIELIGILNYAIFDKNGKHSGLKTFKFPSKFITKPHSVEKLKNVKLISTQDPTDYRVLKYKKDDIIVVSVKVVQDISNVEMFYRLFVTTGKIPTTIPYDTLHEYFEEAIRINGASYDMTSQILGVVVSELCRDSKDETKPFRLSGEKDMNKYKPISITQVPKYISPYTSITSQNWDDAVVNAILLKPGQESPLEKVLMG